MPDTANLICFESDEDLQFYSVLHHELRDALFSMNDLITLFAGSAPLDRDSRLTYLKTDLDPGEFEPSSLLHTFECLRESFIRNHEDVDYCFSHCLPDTPKNRTLSALFHRYIDSPLAEDLADRALKCIEKLKEPGPRAEGTTYFVKAQFSRPLFKELADAFSKRREKVFWVDTWEFPELSYAPRPGRALSADSDTALLAIATKAKRWIADGTKCDSIFIPFSGTRAERQWLHFLLGHLGLPYRDFLGLEIPSTSGEVTHLVSQLRTDQTVPLEMRLRWNHLIVDTLNTLKSDPTSEELLLRLKTQKLPETELDKLSAYVASPTKESEAAPTSGISIVPFHPLLRRPDSRVLAFASSKLFEPRAQDLCLRADECARLKTSGFWLPTDLEDRARKEAQVQAFATDRNSKLFLALAIGHLPGELKVRTRFLRRKEGSKSSLPPETYQVALPLRSLSATQLEAYSRCPTRYLLGNRLKLREGGALSESQYPLLLGQTTHLALEEYFKKRVGGIDLPALIEAFDDALKRLAPQLDSNHPTAIRLKCKFTEFAEKIGFIEGQLHQIVGDGSPQAFELPFTLNLDELTVTGKIDRIEALATGELLILDYKTGNVDFTPDHINQGIHFQALLYLLAAEKTLPKPCAGILFYDLKKGEVRRGLIREASISDRSRKLVTRGHVLTDEAFERLKSAGFERLKATSESIGRGDFRPTPSATICSRCDFPSLCHAGEGYE